MIINKVIASWQDPDRMEEINKMCGLDSFRECTWCDYEMFEWVPKLKGYVSSEELKALKDGEADYIAFRIDY